VQPKILEIETASRLPDNFDRKIHGIDPGTRWNSGGNIKLEESAIGSVVLGGACNEKFSPAGAVCRSHAKKGRIRHGKNGDLVRAGAKTEDQGRAGLREQKFSGASH
jgi:hypothetical protein